MPLIPQRGGRGEQEGGADDGGEEGQAEDEEGVGFEGAAVPGFDAVGVEVAVGVGVECWGHYGGFVGGRMGVGGVVE